MTICINSERVAGQQADVARVVLQSDTTADAAKVGVTGKDIKDLPDATKLYAGSMLVCLQDSTLSLLGTDNKWHKYTP